MISGFSITFFMVLVSLFSMFSFYHHLYGFGVLVSNVLLSAKDVPSLLYLYSSIKVSFIFKKKNLLFGNFTETSLLYQKLSHQFLVHDVGEMRMESHIEKSNACGTITRFWAFPPIVN